MQFYLFGLAFREKNTTFALKMKPKTILIFCALFANLSASAIDIYSRKLNTANGLPDDNVRSIIQDSKGYIWMTTPNGLYRYDGYFFTSFQNRVGTDDDDLGNNHIEICYALSGGRVLVRKKGSVFAVFDVQQNAFLPLPAEERQQLYDQARHVNVDSALLRPFSSILSSGGSCINDNLGNIVVIDTHGRLWFIDRLTGEVIQLDVFDPLLFPLISSHKYKVMTSDRRQLIWVSTNGCGITLYDWRSGLQQHITQQSGLISTDYIVDICLDSGDNLWAADEYHGVVCLSTAHDDGDAFLLQPDRRELRANQVHLMKWSSDSTLLVANTKGDVYEADEELNLRQIMAHTDMHTMCYDNDGRLWIGSRQQGYRSPDGQWHRSDPTDAASPSSNNILSMLCDREGNLWMGCDEGRLDLASDNHRHFLPQACSPKFIVQANDGRLWVGTRQGLFSFRPDELLSDSTAYRQHLQTVRSDMNCFYEDNCHRLWIGTDGDGLYCSDDNGATFSRVTTSDGLIANEIQSITASDDAHLWIATKRGITVYAPDNGKCYYVINEHNPLQNYYADNCVCKLPDGRLAFGTNEGIVVFTPSHLRANPTLNPQNSKLNPQPSTLHFTDLLVNGESVSMQGPNRLISLSPDDVNEVRLSHRQNSLTLRFSTFNYSSTTTRYTYWMEGYDSHWSEVTTYSFATYPNLPPGKYLFHVKAFDNQQGGTVERLLSVVVTPPWWRTWWAWIAYCAVALVVALIVYRQLLTVYRLRRRISIEQQLTEYKLQFFTNISHEFRTPLTIIRGAMDSMGAMKNIPSEMRQPVAAMRKSTDRMMRLINQLLEFRKMQNNKLRLALEEGDIVAFVRDIFQNFTDMAKQKGITFTFTPTVKTFSMFFDRQHVDKMMFNLLSNAFKYTPTGGSVAVHLRIDDSQCTISVSDTGVGIPKEKQGELFQRFMQSAFAADSIGIGLHLTKALVDVHHGTIAFRENEPKGSVFTITLPTSKETYAAEDFLKGSELVKHADVRQNQLDYKGLMGEPLNNRRVLVVEDDADVADFLRHLLGHYFEVQVAMDGVSALDVISRQRPDLVVSDVMMPVMDGFEMTRRIRSDAATQDIPVILLTALVADDKRLKGIEGGADAYLTKPFDEQLLIATCRQLIEQRDKLRQSYADALPERPTAPPEIIVDERDKKMLDAFNHWLYEHISNTSLSVDDAAQAMGYGRSVFYRKVKSLTGMTPADYVRKVRMDRAAELLREETITVAEVAYKVGISEPHYFTKVFKQQFGISPKQYQQGTKREASSQPTN